MSDTLHKTIKTTVENGRKTRLAKSAAKQAASNAAKVPQKRPADALIQSAAKRAEPAPAKKVVRRATDNMNEESDSDDDSEDSAEAAKPTKREASVNKPGRDKQLGCFPVRSWADVPSIKDDMPRLTPPPGPATPAVNVKFDEQPGVKSAAACGLNVTITFPSNMQPGSAVALRAMLDNMIGTA
jgi:hypothetical protein